MYFTHKKATVQVYIFTCKMLADSIMPMLLHEQQASNRQGVFL
jgi:hypothetical protein